MSLGVSQTFTVTFPTKFATTPQFAVLPTRWVIDPAVDPREYVETFQLTVSSLAMTGATVTLLVGV